MRVVGPTIVAAALAVVMAAAAPRASGQECSCTEKDPATSVELQIAASTPTDHSRIGAEQETLVVDLRGDETALAGDAPPLLAGVDLAEVPVLMAADDSGRGDECTGERPTVGSDLTLTGQVYLEETGPVVWTGPCQGTLTVAVAADSDPEDDGSWDRGVRISGAVLVGLALVCFALLALTARGEGRPPSG